MAACGSLAGAIAAAITTPLDVAKTRIILSTKGNSRDEANTLFCTLKDIYLKEGAGRLFSGVMPRVTWISVGGFIFFGAYETSKKYLNSL